MNYEIPSEDFDRKVGINDFQEEPVMTDMTFVLFGATGDLAKRKLFPALYNLFLDGKMPDAISIIGLGRTHYLHDDFRSVVEKALREYSRRPIQTSNLQDFLNYFQYFIFDATSKESYQNLHELIQSRESELDIPENRLFYLSVAPNWSM